MALMAGWFEPSLVNDAKRADAYATGPFMLFEQSAYRERRTCWCQGLCGRGCGNGPSHQATQPRVALLRVANLNGAIELIQSGCTYSLLLCVCLLVTLQTGDWEKGRTSF